MKLALVWLATFWQVGQRTVTRVYFTVEPPRDLAMVTDASPWGAGGVLVHIVTGKPIEGCLALLTKEDAEELGVTIGNSDGQALLELWAIFRAV